jgi:hypothetical protein
MVRRSTPQKKIDDAAFPIRVKLTVPIGGMRVDLMTYWLQDSLPRGDFALHSGDRFGIQDCAAFYFRNLTDARRFLDQFPHYELADGVVGGGYTSPAFPTGRKD